ncbi:hypothetical protein JCM3765_001742 [Sporobolomyces pararoseus]
MAQPDRGIDKAKAPVQHRKLVKKGLFAKDLPPMMYGFGDDYNCAPDTVAVMEELVIDHITDICMQASRIGASRGKVKLDDFRFALRNDDKKLARLEELLFMQEEIARARRGFENPMDYAVDEENLMEKGKENNAAATSSSNANQTTTSGGVMLPGGGKKSTGGGDKSKKSKGKEKA